MEEEKEEVIGFPNFKQRIPVAPKQRTKRGLGARPLLESEIRDIQTKARSAAEAARLLGVSYNTYKKYAKLYNLFEDLKNPAGVGIRKGIQTAGGYHSLDGVPLVLDFLDGNRKNFEYDNLRMLCFNCSFLINGNLTGPRKEYEY